MIGSQSNLNDLLELDQKIEEVKAVKLSEAAQYSSGVVSSGGIFDDKPTGFYRVDSLVDNSAYGAGSGVLTHIKTNDLACQYFTKWTGQIYVGLKNPTSSVLHDVFEVLTTKNTITDANGFIKTA